MYPGSSVRTPPRGVPKGRRGGRGGGQQQQHHHHHHRAPPRNSYQAPSSAPGALSAGRDANRYQAGNDEPSRGSNKRSYRSTSYDRDRDIRGPNARRETAPRGRGGGRPGTASDHNERDRNRAPVPGPNRYKRPSPSHHSSSSRGTANTSRERSGGARRDGEYHHDRDRSRNRPPPAAASGSRDREERRKDSENRPRRPNYPSTQSSTRRGDSSNSSQYQRRNSRNDNNDDDKPRLSALKRLGPKLSVTDRLGTKRQRRQDGPSSSSLEAGSSCASEPAMQITIREGEERREVKDDNDAPGGKGEGAVIVGGKEYIKLECPHCKEKCVTFIEYSSHLHTDIHNKAMKQLKIRLQLTLARMRTKQRTQQLEIEKILDQKRKQETESEDSKEGSGEENATENAKEGADEANKSNATKGKRKGPTYCRTCKLVFHQERADHNVTDMHKLITKFLNPSCEICDTQFFSPMAYERHIGSLSHIKRRVRSNIASEDEDLQRVVELEELKTRSESPNEAGGGLGCGGMDDFMTLDEVGEVEMEMDAGEDQRTDVESLEAKAEAESSSHSEKKGETVEKEDSSKVPKFEFKVGIDDVVGESYIKLVEMYYCDLCHKFLPRGISGTETKEHCKSTLHQQAYLRKKEEEWEQEQESYKNESTNPSTSQDATESNSRDEIGLGQNPLLREEEQLDYEAESVNGDAS